MPCLPYTVLLEDKELARYLLRQKLILLLLSYYMHIIFDLSIIKYPTSKYFLELFAWRVFLLQFAVLSP